MEKLCFDGAQEDPVKWVEDRNAAAAAAANFFRVLSSPTMELRIGEGSDEK